MIIGYPLELINISIPTGHWVLMQWAFLQSGYETCYVLSLNEPVRKAMKEIKDQIDSKGTLTDATIEDHEQFKALINAVISAKETKVVN